MRIDGYIYYVILGLFNSTSLIAQQELGYPLSEVFLPKQYKGSTQNWAICESNDGLIYVGNREGLLEFDGVHWRKETLVEGSVVRSLAKGQNGQVYVGLSNDFGYLRQDSIQSLIYHSISSHLPDSIKNYQDIWSIQVINQKVYFQSGKYLFIYDIKQQSTKTIKVNIGRADRSFAFNGNYYINTTNQSSEHILCILKDERFEVFTEELGKARWIIPYKKQKVFLSSANYPLAIYDFQKRKIEALPVNFDEVLQEIKQAIPYHLIQLNEDIISVATLKGGIFQLNFRTGNVKRINQNTGLTSNEVLYQFLDSQGNLWLAQDESITCFRYSEPLKYYSKIHGLQGTPYSSYLHHNRDFYVGTSISLLKLNRQSGKLELTQERKGQTWQVFSDSTEIHTVQTEGILTLDKKRSTLDFRGDPWMISRLGKHPSLFVMANYNNGLSIIEKKGGKLTLRNHLKGFKENARKVTQDYEGNFWVSDRKVGVWKITPNASLDSIINIELFDKKKGLPSDKQNYVYSYLKEGKKVVLIGTLKGFYTYNYEGDSVQTEIELNKALSNLDRIRNSLAFDEDGNLLCVHGKHFLYLEKQANQKYTADTLSFMPIYDLSLDEIQYLGNHTFSIACAEGLFLYNSKKKYQYAHHFKALIREVNANNRKIYGGIGTPLPAKIDYKTNNLLFRFSSPLHGQSEALMFSYKLEGLDDTWSKWSKITFKEYTNLWEGDYKFKVKAKNLYGQESEVAIYQFDVSPPWFRQPIAYLVYVFISIGLIWLGVRWYTLKLRRENEELEQIITERTLEISNQKEEIIQQSEELKTSNEKLLQLNQFKEDMGNMVVHDFKAPLNSIIWYGKGNEKVEASAQRLQHLLENFLDVHRGEEVGMQLNQTTVAISEVVKQAMRQAESLAVAKSIQLIDQVPKQLAVKADHDLLLRVLVNLMSNAVKYTPTQGKVSLAAVELDEHIVRIAIKDTGVGIPKDKIGQLFEKYAQAEMRKSGNIRSTGLGLTFCKMAIEAHSGTIWVESEERKGTTFFFTLQISAAVEAIPIDQVTEWQLSNETQALIRPFISQLSELNDSQVAEVRKVLKQIEDEADLLKKWKEEIMKSCFANNAERYRELLKMIS